MVEIGIIVVNDALSRVKILKNYLNIGVLG